MPDRAVTRIIIYTLPYCADCRAAKALLTALGVPYHEINIAQISSAAEQMLRVNGGRRATPTICIGRRVLVEPDRAALEATLREAGLLPRS